MPLTSGARLGPYEVTGELGVGGMGEVYRARDTKLKRDVALKVLPELLAGDPDRLARFRREAQVLASLNHPNIAAIHGFEDSGQTHALVMELVEGPTLADLITSTPLQLSPALAIARQLIDALEAAHDSGIVHRDLKPANVKVRDDGTVKVLDFGLAKALDPTDPSSAASVSNSPTLTARATQMGMILGTAAYMAPEQARGRPVDRRADIWAFGVVLYEMLSGRRAFEGDDVSITLAAVLKEDVTWDALPADLPAPIRRLLRRCLEKDPKRRLGAISDARFELDEATSPSSADAAAPGAVRSRLTGKERVIWAALTLLALATAGLFAWWSASGDEPAPQAVVRFGVLPPDEGLYSGTPPRFSISPDGRFLAFAASARPGLPDQLWLRRLESLEVTPIAGTESGAGGLSPQSPFWSPDGQRLAFFLQSQEGASGDSMLRVVDLGGGGIQVVCDLPSNNAGGSWNAEGVMLVSSQGTKGIQRVPATGGVPMPVTTLDESRQETAHLFPQFLPDGRHFIYQVLTKDRSGWATFVGSIDSPERQMLVQSDHARFAAPNLLLYVMSENLMAQTMDMNTRQLTGEPLRIATGLGARAANGRAGFAVSGTGVLVYYSNADPEQGSGVPERQLTWVDRSGTPIGTVGTPTSAASIRLSPDTGRVAMTETVARPGTVSRTLWVADLGRNVKAPLTTATTTALSPAWSADGTRLLFASRIGEGSLTIAERAASGATAATTRYEEKGSHLIPLDESSDGDLIVFSKSQTLGQRRSLHFVSKQDGMKPRPYLTGEFDYAQASLSTDGKWLAYASNESGGYQVVVQPFPDASQGKSQISTNGGASPRWRRDGRELFYVDDEQRLMAVPIAINRTLEPGTPRPLFSLPARTTLSTFGGAYVYDAAPDGQRFLVSIPTRAAAAIPLTVTTNWTTLLKK